MVDSCDVTSKFFPTEHTTTCGYAVSDTDVIKQLVNTKIEKTNIK